MPKSTIAVIEAAASLRSKASMSIVTGRLFNGMST